MTFCFSSNFRTLVNRWRRAAGAPGQQMIARPPIVNWQSLRCSLECETTSGPVNRSNSCREVSLPNERLSADSAENGDNVRSGLCHMRQGQFNLKTLPLFGQWAMDRPAPLERSNPARTWRMHGALPSYLNIRACRHRSGCISPDASTPS